jgi:PAS domain S-box-containing protein
MRDEERYRAIVESVPEGVAMSDADDRITYANPALGRMLGIDPAAMVGRTVTEFVTPAGQPTLADALVRRRQGVTERYEVVLARPGGGELVAEVSAKPLVGGDGEYLGSIAIVVDGTERRRLETHLQQKQRLETVGQLAGGIAHDFNNLLAVILNYAHFVRSRIPDEDAALRDDVDQIRHAAERASELVRQLLIFGRRDPAVPETVDVNRLVRDTERLLRRTIGEQVELVSSLCETRCFVEIDPAQLEHALLNLVVNARDAMPEGGTVTIASRREKERVVLSVRDDGPGMEPDVAARAFEPFFTTKPKGSGTGLGLATVYGVITAAGGDVRIDSRPGEGTTVSVLLPAADGGTILLVEDEEPVRELTRRILAEGGFDCLVAADAAEAIELFEANRDSIDVILTDVVMPGMSGPELVEHLGGAAPPAVYMTGYADQRLEGVLEKPFDADALLRAVSAARDRQ